MVIITRITFLKASYGNNFGKIMLSECVFMYVILDLCFHFKYVYIGSEYHFFERVKFWQCWNPCIRFEYKCIMLETVYHIWIRV